MPASGSVPFAPPAQLSSSAPSSPKFTSEAAQPAVNAVQARHLLDKTGAEEVFLLLQKAYPTLAGKLVKDSEKGWLLVMEQATVLLDDGIQREGEELQNAPTVLDTLKAPYPVGAGGREPEKGADPGRSRNTSLMAALYGPDRATIEQSLVRVDFLGTEVSFTKLHGAASALSRVAESLKQACVEDNSLKDWLLPIGGHYTWRQIAGTKRLSAHSFGIAIDLNVQKGIYWKWKSDKKLLAQTRENFPQVIVDAFEKEGFVWGGKWSHFDFMHFEYRPEVILKNSPAPKDTDQNSSTR